ncbi:MAG: hypothetical protein F9K16_00170 [Thermoanaerobaculia bacterium]|nr:MAG: hypothetical protein F9K16_00170 [Thermoanaerobaculia bacterium]MBZ0103430.1 hypothetical protein [Thermoanaerobaculia bacterium]
MSADPQNDPIVWYPGSGRDVGLCLTDIDDNPVGLHLRRADGSGDVRLWMSDYHPEVEAEMSRETPEVSGFESPDWKQQFGVSGLRCRNVDTLVSADWSQVRKETGELRRADMFPEADNPRYDRATLEVEVDRRSRGIRSRDRYEVWFSPFESGTMVRRVLAPGRFAVVGIVLLRVGGFGDLRPPGPTHHEPPFFDEVAKHLGLPEFVLTDEEPGERSPWTRRPYEVTGHALQGWKVPATVNMYRRRD